jgi:type II secretory pathway pseudopilin PulG
MTLVEILIAMVIVVTLAAIVYPTVAGQLRRGQASALANQLDNLREALGSYRENVQRYPSALTQLTTQPTVGATDICAVAIPAANRALWRGPYLNQSIAGDFQVGEDTVQNVLGSVVTVAPLRNLRIFVLGVDTLVAAELEREFDGPTLNYGTGTVLWTAAGSGTLTFQFPIRGC